MHASETMTQTAPAVACGRDATHGLTLTSVAVLRLFCGMSRPAVVGACAALIAICSGECHTRECPELPHEFVCRACVGDLVHPGNGSETELFAGCFAVVADVCGPEDSHYRFSFCHNWKKDGVAAEDAQLMHVLDLENWKLDHCDWIEPFRHTQAEEETAAARADLSR